MIAWLNNIDLNLAIAIDTRTAPIQTRNSAGYWINFKSSHKAAKLCS